MSIELEKIYKKEDIENIESLDGLKFVYLIDIEKKRKNKKSTPTFILNYIESNPNATAKDIENYLTNSTNKDLLTNFNTALAVSKAKYNKVFTKREYLKRRINKTLGYYTAKDVINTVFSGLIPLIKEVLDGKDRYTLTGKVFPVK